MTHGTTSGYDGGCGCDDCSAANRRHNADMRAALAGREPPIHGTKYAYNMYACRCPLCRRANAQYQREYRERKGRAA